MVEPIRLQSNGKGRYLTRVLWVLVFAMAFGYVEASVVVYLRAIYDPLRASLYPGYPPDSLLPLITLDQLRAANPEHVRRVAIELGREMATMLMLAAVAALATRRRGEWLAMFMIGFGCWDVSYYVGLKAMIGFPASLLTWDILFLLPVPWLGPVLAPLIVSASMVGAGLVLLARTAQARPLSAKWYHWCGIALGGFVIILSFCRDYARTSAGELPRPFSWTVFAVGETVGLLSFVHALRQVGHSGGRSG